ncbi:MAG: type II 3-dehydroquinate dehydratase [Flavobacteriales bacterium]|nr:MAG: type II 3-dehydroquinate dehydratase [Flavobacteriales bacterium]
MRILILNGPNLNLLGSREPHIYGNTSFDAYLPQLQAMFPQASIVLLQSNIEGELVEALQQAPGKYDAVVLNAAGYSHTSVALRDTVATLSIPVVEVHISNIHAREEFRHNSLTGSVSKGVISGLGLDGYRLAIDHLLRMEP